MDEAFKTVFLDRHFIFILKKNPATFSCCACG